MEWAVANVGRVDVTGRDGRGRTVTGRRRSNDRSLRAREHDNSRSEKSEERETHFARCVGFTLKNG